MNDELCQWLDDYLDRDLAPADSRRFQVHLSVCPACAAAVADWGRNSALLRAAGEREAVPATLADRIANRRHSYRQRVALLMGAGATLAASLWLLIHRNEPAPPFSPNTPKMIAAAAPPVVVTFSERLLAVPEETGSPNISFYWVYPKLNPTEVAQGSPQ